MANEIKTAFEQAYPDGPQTFPDMPEKVTLRGLGQIIQTEVDDIRAASLLGVQPQKPAVHVLTTTAVSPATGMENGDVVDGVTLVTGMSVARAVSPPDALNGIYVVPVSGAASRRPDAGSQDELLGCVFSVDFGTHARETWALQTTGTIVVGTTVLDFQKIITPLPGAIIEDASGGYQTVSYKVQSRADLSRPVMTDNSGWVFAPASVTATGATTGTTGGFTFSEILAFNAEAIAYSAKIDASARTGIYDIHDFEYNLITAYGQSHNGSAYSAVPALTTEPPFQNVKSLGASTRPSANNTETFNLTGSNDLYPLAASDDNGGLFIQKAQYDAWVAGGWVPNVGIVSSYRGEASCVAAALQFWQLVAAESNPGTNLVVSNTAVSDSLIYNLMKRISSGTATISIATPAVVTWTGHGMSAGASVIFTTDGALPTGITSGSQYYVIAAGLTANTFQFSLTVGGAAINTSGTQSGTHTVSYGGSGISGNYNRTVNTAAKLKSLLETSVTVTIADPAILTWTAHGRVAGDAVLLSTTGALPTGLTANTRYYAMAVGLTANTMQIARTKKLAMGARITAIFIGSPGFITLPKHGLSSGNPVIFSTTGALPTGIVAGTQYFVSATGLDTNNFQISATNGGAVITPSGAQSGVHSLTSHIVTTGAQSGVHSAISATKAGNLSAIILHGEANNSAVFGAQYEPELAKMYDDFHDDISGGIFGQTEPRSQKRAAVFLHAASKTWADPSFATPEATLRLSLKREHMVAVAPYYQWWSNAVDSGNHWTANGYRGHGCKIGQVMYRVIRQKRGWQPTYCFKARYQDGGDEVILQYHAPEAPIRFGTPYQTRTATYDSVSKGYVVSDTAGEVLVTEVTIPQSQTVRIKLSRPLASAPTITYAELAAHAGLGCIRDSDPFVPMFGFELGFYTNPAEAGGGTVGVPYDMSNWAWPQIIIGELA